MSPMQPIVLDPDGAPRFQQNAIVRYMLDTLRKHQIADLDSMMDMNFSNEDWNQFVQLLGYSVCGFGELNFADPAIVKEADRVAKQLKSG